MTPFAIALLSLSMSADACAAAIGRGAVHRPSPIQALRGGFVFGAVEAVTPIVGWAVGLAAATIVAAIDHWIAFGLLGLIGAKMAWEGWQRGGEEAEAPAPGRRGVMALVLMATGTSIDAAAVGVTLAFLKENIFLIAASIGLTTFSLTTLGMMMGRSLGARFGARVEIVGGLILIGIGTKILMEHTQLIA
jgi:manganese efflux pump family protein